MTTSVLETRPAVEAPADGAFEVSLVTGDGAVHRMPLAQGLAVPFEQCRPVRRFTSRKGQRHLSGLWWSATTGAHVGFESWLERDVVAALDFDPAVVGIASQPLWLHWTNAAGKAVSHAPDYFARRMDGSAVVVDCRPVERRKPSDVAKFDATSRACAAAGWEYRLVGRVDALVTANLRWLAGYRHPRYRLPEIVHLLRQAFNTPTPLLTGANAVGDPIAVLPVLFHLMWCHDVRADLSSALHQETVLTLAAVAQ